jgi:ribosome-binding protein aMBF1 (putative translation factor)
MLEAGKCRSIADIAEAEKIDRSFVSRLLRLMLLAPDIQEAIIEGRQPKGMQLEELARAIPGEWDSPPLIKRFLRDGNPASGIDDVVFG